MQQIEILAPAGSPDALAAALDAGADAVYFGLKKLNARQGAANFLPSRLKDTLEMIHSRGGKAYLTLNIDLCQRDLGEAARTLELARQCKVDAVLVKDPALLAMKPYFPDLTFHFSTQAGISASPGVTAARHLGISRVVLARELSREEIRVCCSIPDMEIEIFVQGAMCFSCSGRCLLSSWIGGRSGNRGACASPCRFLWKSSGQPEDSRPFSMHDLCLLEHVSELQQMGVCSLKIEGRLKAPRWVSDAVHLYRQGLEKDADTPSLLSRACTLGNYTGRQLTDAYYRGERSGLTGESARPASAPGGSCSTPAAPVQHSTSAAPPSNLIECTVDTDEKDGILITWNCGENSRRLRIPPQRIANAKRALKLADIFAAVLPADSGFRLALVLPDSLEEKLLPKRHLSLITDDLQDFIRTLEKEEDGNVRIGLASELRSLVTPRPVQSSPNHVTLGGQVRYIRLGPEECSLSSLPACGCSIIYNWHPGSRRQEDQQLAWLKKNRSRLFSVALPQVCYEEELPSWKRLLQYCRQDKITVEINSWEGWELSRQLELSMIGGSGMEVLNSLAADYLQGIGCSMVTVSPEIDRKQLEDLCSRCRVPLLLTVFSRPVLFQSRVSDAVPEGHPVEDSKKFRLIPRKAGSLTQYRPENPVDWRGLKNPRIRVAALVMDFTGSPNPEEDWRIPAPPKTPFLFNYDRQLR